jgi:hypothetical protein
MSILTDNQKYNAAKSIIILLGRLSGENRVLGTCHG